MKRRMTFLACLAALLLPAGAFAQSKPIRIIVPFAVGGASDTYTRLVAQKITEQTGKNIVVENKTGAGGRIAFDYAAKSPADGSVVALIDATYAMLPGLFNNLPWDVNTDLVPVVMITQTPFVILVQSDSKIGSLGDLLTQAKAQPGKLTFASAGPGNTSHLSVEYLKSRLGLDMIHVPYKGSGPAIIGLLGGEVNFMFEIGREHV